MNLSQLYKINFKNLIYFLFLSCSLIYSNNASAEPKLISTIGKAALFKHIQNLAVSSTGQIYVLDTTTSTAIHKLDNAGNLIETLDLGNTEILDMTVSSDGYFYTTGVKYADNTYTGTVKKWSPSGQLLLSWNLMSGTYEQAIAKLAITNDNRLVVATQSKISIFSEQGLLLKEIKGYIRPNFPDQIKPFSFITHLAINENNELLALDTNNKLISINLEGKLLRPIVINNINNIGKSLSSNLAYDNQGFIYDNQVSVGTDSFSACHCIRQFDSSGKLVKTWGGLGSKRGQFSYPVAFRLDKNNNLYIADSGNSRIQKLSRDGSSVWSTGDQLGQLGLTKDIAVDSSKNVYVLDAGHYRIQKFAANGTFLKSWGSLGLKRGQFSYLQKITIDPQDRVYVEDLYYNKASSNYKERIQIFSSEGSFLAIPQQTWPSFDKQGNTYRTVHKLDLATNEYDYFLQKTDINQQTQEWPLNYKSTYADYGLSVSSTYPCIHSISIDTQKNIYLLRCYSSASYHDSHHPSYTIKISLQKIDPNNGRVLAEKEILNNQNEFGSTLPPIKMSIDEQDFIYLQHEPSYLFSGQSLLDPDENITVFDTNFNKLGIYLNTATATSVYSANNQLYVTDSVINIYELASSLKAPILMNVRPLDNQGLAQLYWQDRTTDETGFKIYRCKVVDLSCSDFQLVKTLKANVNSARLAAPADFTVGSGYRYKLTAIKGKEESLTYNVMQIKF